ncbi:MAG: 16S rRNA (guanine(966)-N(2))-methyltransferase RsmD [candidate division WOR-3 bacterium]
MRILAGMLKGKLLRYPKNKIRPTTELIRGAIFNILAPKIIQARVADFFCGAGSLGIEALSRGAKLVYFFEKSKLALRYLRQNLGNLPGAFIVEGDGLNKIKTINQQFDIIIADPPYEKGLINQFIKKVVKSKILAPNGVIVLQYHKKEAIALPEGLIIVKQKRYGDNLISIIRRQDENCGLSG